MATETTYPARPERLTQPSESDAEIFARVLLKLTRRRDYWLNRAYAAEQETLQLRQELERMEDAWMRTETIQPDGSLRPPKGAKPNG